MKLVSTSSDKSNYLQDSDKSNYLEKFSTQAEEDLLASTMKLDELMAGLEDFLNAPAAKRQKVEI